MRLTIHKNGRTTSFISKFTGSFKKSATRNIGAPVSGQTSRNDEIDSLISAVDGAVIIN